MAVEMVILYQFLCGRHVFWNHNYPLGRADVRTQDMIDVDEAGFKIESTVIKR